LTYKLDDNGKHGLIVFVRTGLAPNCSTSDIKIVDSIEGNGILTPQWLTVVVSSASTAGATTLFLPPI